MSENDEKETEITNKELIQAKEDAGEHLDESSSFQKSEEEAKNDNYVKMIQEKENLQKEEETNNENDAKMIQEKENLQKEKEAKNENERKKKTQILYPIVFAIFAVIVSILIYHFRKRERAISYEKPNQYVFNSNFKNELQKYIDFPEHKNILILYGASGVGKTRGLLTFENENIV